MVSDTLCPAEYIQGIGGAMMINRSITWIQISDCQSATGKPFGTLHYQFIELGTVLTIQNDARSVCLPKINSTSHKTRGFFTNDTCSLSQSFQNLNNHDFLAQFVKKLFCMKCFAYIQGISRQLSFKKSTYLSPQSSQRLN